MSGYVLDANVLFSRVLSLKELYLQLARTHTFHVPDFALLELEKYRHTILKKAKGDFEELKNYTHDLFDSLVILPGFFISQKAYTEASELCADIDPKDTVYVALAIELNLKLLTRDKPLHDGLKRKGFPLIKLFDEFVREELPA